jgi:hypothetical protein
MQLVTGSETLIESTMMMSPPSPHPPEGASLVITGTANKNPVKDLPKKASKSLQISVNMNHSSPDGYKVDSWKLRQRKHWYQGGLPSTRHADNFRRNPPKLLNAI